MLVLSRQRDETIMIGDEIEITVVDIRGDKVRLGITAPTTIAVHRKEVYEAIRRENEHAARLNGDIQMISQTIQPGPERAAARSRAAQLARPVRAPSLPEPTVTTAKKQPAKRTG
ncbi:MAG TPA: carbon storage regulator CsrA [Phycisphaerales bacterium]|nr:carbon storage regulator CsrA [Phycisphaerales bacterium]